MNHERNGFVLVSVLLVIIVAAAVATGAAVLGTNTHLMSQYKDRQGLLQSIAEAGVEEGRARLNGDNTLYPRSGHVTLEDGVPVVDASGAPIGGIRRYTYAGPIGDTTGQYGVFGSVVSVAEAANGDRFIRRMEVLQESFAKYAYFTTHEPTAIAFGNGDQIFGPVHSNDVLKIYDTGATFHDVVTTGATINGKQYGTFKLGYTEYAKKIYLPETADLNRLRTYAEQGGTAIGSTTSGGPGQATTRIEFLAIDLNGDGEVTGADEGFMRVYRNTTPEGPAWVTAHRPATGIRDSKNCGDIHDDGIFYPAASHGTTGTSASDTHSWFYALQSMPSRRCYLGGDPRLWRDGFTAGPDEMGGRWLRWEGTVDPRLAALGRPDRDYLFPLSRLLNPNFKGVIFVDGKVAVSGRLRGRLTVAATGSIIIADDIRYAVDPAAATCRDILGLFTAADVIVADNTINAPQVVNGTYSSLDDTRDEFIHGVVLALQNFEVENYNTGSTSAEPCGTTVHGRGCLYLTGGIIQSTRGSVGTTNRAGYLKRYAYDPCAFSSPPPYFPTTRHFARSRLFDVDPTGFDPTAHFALLKPSQ